MRTTLESGAWIEHVPIQELKGKHKRGLDRVGKPQPIFTADGVFDQAATMSGVDVLTWMAAKQEALWAMLIGGWSFELPVPQFDWAAGTVAGGEAFGELPLEDFTALEALMEPFEVKLGRRPDPKARGAATISGSNGSSPARRGGSRKG